MEWKHDASKHRCSLEEAGYIEVTYYVEPTDYDEAKSNSNMLLLISLHE